MVAIGIVVVVEEDTVVAAVDFVAAVGPSLRAIDGLLDPSSQYRVAIALDLAWTSRNLASTSSTSDKLMNNEQCCCRIPFLREHKRARNAGQKLIGKNALFPFI